MAEEEFNNVITSNMNELSSEEDEEEENEIEKLCSVDTEDDSVYRSTVVSYQRPTNTSELAELQESPGDIPSLFGDNGMISIGDLIVDDVDKDCDENGKYDKQSVSLVKLLHFEKLLRLIGELLSTEMNYVKDLDLLCSFLDECTYCSKPAVVSFVNSTTFIGESHFVVTQLDFVSPSY